MGFKSSIVSATGLTIGSSGRFNLNADNFLAMYNKDIPDGSISVSSKPCTFKIPLSAGYGSVCYYSEATGFAQWIDIPASYDYNMDRLTVAIYDRWAIN
jgi:hypothetical protein